VRDCLSEEIDDNIKVDLKEKNRKMDWIYVDQDMEDMVL
jgi:hypothetical protein